MNRSFTLHSWWAGYAMRAMAHRLPHVLIVAALLLASAGTAPAQPHKLQPERAAAERGQGRILPLEQLLQSLARQLPGRAVGVELEEDDGRMVYELKWLLPDGRRLEIDIDASSGRWLSLKGARLETVFLHPGPRP
jgi:hypothetical protein